MGETLRELVPCRRLRWRSLNYLFFEVCFGPYSSGAELERSRIVAHDSYKMISSIYGWDMGGSGKLFKGYLICVDAGRAEGEDPVHEGVGVLCKL